MNLQSGSTLKIIRASAGSGKTFALAANYLLLALRSPEYFKRILAVTFTNKATAEMKERVLDYLIALKKGDKIPVLTKLKEESGWSEEEIRKRAGGALTAILHQYSFFQVSTIDSFFQKVIRSFAKEIGLQGGFKVQLDANAALEAVIDDMLVEMKEEDALSDWLVEFSESRVDEGKHFDVRNELMQLGKELFKEEFNQVEEQVLQATSDAKMMKAGLEKLKAYREKTRNTATGLAKGLLHLMEKKGYVIEDFVYGRSGCAIWVERIANELIFDLGAARVSDAYQDPEKMYAKSKKNTPFAQFCHEEFHAPYQNLYRFIQEEEWLYNTVNKVLANYYTLGIIAHLSQRLRDYRDEHDLMFISDAGVFLSGIIGGNDAPFIYEKIGNRFQHFLIDEFQDTSGLQWVNFKPLIENSLASGHGNLIVGDVKQAIYRWRSGDWALLHQGVENSLGSIYVSHEPLDTNYRSLANIIAFNNAVFQVAPSFLMENLQATDHDELYPTLQALKETGIAAYEGASQELGRKQDPEGGFVRIQLLDTKAEKEEIQASEEEEDIDNKEVFLRKLPAMVEDLQLRGYRASDIAFLVRNKKDGSRIASFFAAYKDSGEAQPLVNYNVLSDESLYLNAALPVRFLIALFAYIQKPQEAIPRFEAYYFYQEVKEKQGKDWVNITQGGQSEEMWPEAFREKMKIWSKYPLYELAEELIRIFELNQTEVFFPYLQVFLDTILQYQGENKPNLKDFLDWWEIEGSNRALPFADTGEAMKIFTIHKSKGLQFKVVIIPFCDWEFAPGATKSNILWLKTPPHELFQFLPYAPFDMAKGWKKTLVEEEGALEKVRHHLDNLNMLYVAFTRAEEGLLVLAPDGRSKKGDVSVGHAHKLLTHLLTRNLLDTAGTWNSEEMRYELGEMPEMVFQKTSTHEASKAEPDESLRISEFTTNHWSDKLFIRQVAKDYFLQDQLFVSRLNRGVLLHDLMAEIRYSRDIERVVDQFVFQGLIRAEDREEYIQKITRWTSLPEVSDWFSEAWQVKNEVPVLPKDGQLKRLDRVMIRGKQAIILDYKSGKPEKSHQKQVQEYVRLVSAMGYESVKGYLFYMDAERLVLCQ